MKKRSVMLAGLIGLSPAASASGFNEGDAFKLLKGLFTDNQVLVDEVLNRPTAWNLYAEGSNPHWDIPKYGNTFVKKPNDYTVYLENGDQFVKTGRYGPEPLIRDQLERYHEWSEYNSLIIRIYTG